jgi:hypothetical protein
MGQAEDKPKPRAFNDPDVFETDADVAEFERLYEKAKAKLEKTKNPPTES